MFSHVVLGSNDLERSRTFYDAIIGALGGDPGTIDAKGRLIYQHDGGRLVITRPVNGNAATSGNGTTIVFVAASSAQADAWHAAGIAGGGSTAEDPPGVREMPAGKFYLAYLRDPDGNKLCGRHPMAG